MQLTRYAFDINVLLLRHYPVSTPIHTKHNSLDYGAINQQGGISINNFNGCCLAWNLSLNAADGAWGATLRPTSDLMQRGQRPPRPATNESDPNESFRDQKRQRKPRCGRRFHRPGPRRPRREPRRTGTTHALNPATQPTTTHQ